MLVGDKMPFLSLLIAFRLHENGRTLSPALKHIANSIGSRAETIEELVADDCFGGFIAEKVAQLNLSAVSNAQKVRKWAVLPCSLSEEGDTTPQYTTQHTT